MATNRHRPYSMLALAILELLAEAPMHPYEMKQRMVEREHARAIPFKQASIYDTVERLTEAGLVEPLLTNRDGRRPERTIYRLTPAGADELDTWVRHLLEEPTREYPRFGAALMFLGALRKKEEAIRVLERRAVAYEADIANIDAKLGQLPAELPRLFTIEEEYGQAMRRAELEWIRRTIVELKDGSLDWPQMLEQQQPMG